MPRSINSASGSGFAYAAKDDEAQVQSRAVSSRSAGRSRAATPATDLNSIAETLWNHTPQGGMRAGPRSAAGTGMAPRTAALSTRASIAKRSTDFNAIAETLWNHGPHGGPEAGSAAGSTKAPSSASSVRFTKGDGYSSMEPGCIICSVAMLAKVNYWNVRRVAERVAGFTGKAGLTLLDARRILHEFGISASERTKVNNSWSQFPDRAIVSVDNNGELHAVVFRRKNGEELIYDWLKNGPVRTSGYQLSSYNYYLEIHQ